MDGHKTDAMGKALAAYYNGKEDAEIIVHSNLVEDDVIPVHYLFREKAAMPELEQLALDKCRGSVLDIGAGAGSHALALQEMGLDVVAIDISDGAVEVMQKRGVKQAELANIFFYSGQKFDTLLLLMNGIGLVGTLGELDIFLKHIRSLLNKGGQVLLDSSDILYLFENEDGSVDLNLNGDYYGQVVYQMEYEDTITEPFKWLFIDYLTLEDHATALGFSCEMLYQDEYDQFLARLVLEQEAD